MRNLKIRIATFVNGNIIFNISYFPLQCPFYLELEFCFFSPYVSLSGKKKLHVKFLHSKPTISWLGGSSFAWFHKYTVNFYYTNCTNPKGQCATNCTPYPFIYFSTVILRLCDLFTHESLILIIWKSDKTWQQFVL